MILTVILALTQVFRLEVCDEDRTARIVGVDGVRREVVLVSPDEYAALTNDAVRAWHKLHETEEGRRKLHGRRINTKVEPSKTGGMNRVDTYEDGFRFPWPMSARHLEFRAKLNTAKKPKEITVEHDATTGKDTVK